MAPGRIVHFKKPEDGTVRPAIITHAHSEECVNLQIFLDGTYDNLDNGNTIVCTSVVRGDNLGQWQWPPVIG